MKIIKLTIENFLGIEEFNLTKTGKFNIIKGGNGTGKSAVLKAIKETCRSSGVDPEIIYEDEKQAKMMVGLTDGKNNIEINRTATSSTNTVKVVDNGESVKKPVAFLNKLFGPYNFNPIDFFNADAKKRRAMLLSIMPMKIKSADIKDAVGDAIFNEMSLEDVDFSKHALEVIEKIKAKIYDIRHEQNLVVTRLKKAIEQDRQDMPETFDADKWADFDVAKVRKQYESALKECSEHRNKESELESMKKESSLLQEQIEQKEEQIKRLQAEIADMNERREKIIVDGSKLKKEISGVNLPDPATYEEQLNEYETHRKLVYRLEEIKKKEIEYTSEKGKHEFLDNAYKVIAVDVPKKLLQESESPVKGMTIEGESIKWRNRHGKNVSIDKLSTSESITFGVDVAKSTSGEAPIILVDGIESLDPDILEAFFREAEKDDFQYLITMVTRGELMVERFDIFEKTVEEKRPELDKSGI